jgi:large subunit ribosomal protein L15
LVSLEDLEKKIAEGFTGVVDRKILLDAQLIDDNDRPIKLLGNGEVSKSFSVKVDKITAGARAKIEAAGGRWLGDEN